MCYFGVSDLEREQVWTWMHESLNVNAQKWLECKKVWWTHKSLMSERKSEPERKKGWWTHEILDMRSSCLGRSGHKHFPSAAVWTYRFPSGTSTWDHKGFSSGTFRLAPQPGSINNPLLKLKTERKLFVFFPIGCCPNDNRKLQKQRKGLRQRLIIFSNHSASFLLPRLIQLIFSSFFSSFI